MSKLKNLKIRCFFDVSIDDKIAGRIIFELFNDVCPKTCENFKSLCTGELGQGKTTGKSLHYKGVPFHRVIRGFMIQSGDFSSGNGKGGESIYGGTFADENFHYKHDKPYLLSMANRGPNTNGSQFFITLAPTPHLDGVHVVFGHVLSGKDVIEKIASQPVDSKAKPQVECSIANCGQLIPQLKEKDGNRKSKKDKNKKDKKKDKKNRKKAKKHKHNEESSDDSSSSSSSSSDSSSSSSSDSDSDEDSKSNKKIKLDKTIENGGGDVAKIAAEEDEEEEEGEIRDLTPMKNPHQTTSTNKQRENHSPLPWAPKVYSSKFKSEEIPEVPVNRFLSREPRHKPIDNIKEKEKDKEQDKEKNKEKEKKRSSERDEKDGAVHSRKYSNEDRRYYDDRRYDDRRYDERNYDRRYEDRRYENKRYDDRRYGDRRYDDRYGRDYRRQSSYYDRDGGRKVKGRGKFHFRRSITPPHWRSKTKTLDEALGKTKPKVEEEREVTLRFDTIDRKINIENKRSRSRSRSGSLDYPKRSKRDRSRDSSRSRSRSKDKKIENLKIQKSRSRSDSFSFADEDDDKKEFKNGSKKSSKSRSPSIEESEKYLKNDKKESKNYSRSHSRSHSKSPAKQYNEDKESSLSKNGHRFDRHRRSISLSD